MRRWLLPFALAMLAGGGVDAETPDTLKIGAILAISGPASVFGAPADKGLRMLVDQLSKSGGLAGHPVKLTVYDTGGDTSKAAQLFRRLVDNDEVDVVVGPSTSGESLAIVPVANQMKVANITNGGAEPITNPVTPFVFSVSPTDRLCVEALLTAMVEHGYKTLGVIYSSDGYGQSGGTLAKALAHGFGVEIVADETFSPQDADMTPQLLRIRERNPDALLIWSANPGPTIVLKDAAQIGFAKPTYLSYANASLSFVKQTGPYAEGAYTAALRILSPESLPDGDGQKAALIKLDQDYRQTYGVGADLTVGHALDQILWITEALKTIKGPITREGLRAGLEQASFCGADGCRKVSPGDHRGLTKDSMVIMQVKDGKWTAATP